METYRRTRGGYTILEVIIVLTISSALFAAAVTGYSMQNRRTQFTESVQTFAQELQDVLNDVETGFYPSNSDFKCVANASGGKPDPNTQTGTAAQGTNETCTFVGKAIQFGPAGNNGSTTSDIDIYTIVGRRLLPNSVQAAVTIDQAQPVGLDRLVSRKSLSAGVEIESVRQANTNNYFSGVAMVSTSNDASGVSSGINSRASLATVAGNIGNSKTAFLAAIEGINSTSINTASQGINICLQEKGGTGRFAIIELSKDSNQIIINPRVDARC